MTATIIYEHPDGKGKIEIECIRLPGAPHPLFLVTLGHEVLGIEASLFTGPKGLRQLADRLTEIAEEAEGVQT